MRAFAGSETCSRLSGFVYCGPVLTLTFHPTSGDLPAQTRAIYFRFCADGTLRGADNAIAAVYTDNRWRLGQRWFRELECAGPVWLRCREAEGRAFVKGPYSSVRTVNGQLFVDDVELPMDIPGWRNRADEAPSELSLLSSAS
jgi:hypothetical protein